VARLTLPDSLAMVLPLKNSRSPEDAEVDVPEETTTGPLASEKLPPVRRLRAPLEPEGEEPVERMAGPEAPDTTTSLVDSSKLPEPVERPTPEDTATDPPRPAAEEPAEI